MLFYTLPMETGIKTFRIKGGYAWDERNPHLLEELKDIKKMVDEALLDWDKEI